MWDVLQGYGTKSSSLWFGDVGLYPQHPRTAGGLHVKAALRMTGKLPVLAHGIWTYTKTSEVLAAEVLRNMEHYVRVRRARILKWVKQRPIYQLCQRAVRRRGTPPHTFWWELPMHLDDATGGTPAVVADEGEGGKGGGRNVASNPGPLK